MAAFAPRTIALLVGLALSTASLAADAKTLRWAGRGDPQTMDPYSQNENLTNNINSFIYDTLVMRDKDLKVIPGLATSWEQVNPTTWRFKLRQGVKFHDGSPFTPEDVVFSFERASADTSQIRAYATASGKARIVDEATVEFVTNGPNPIELEHLVTIFIMSKSWCEKNKCMKPLDFKNKEEMITARQANGTGAFILKAREPDVRTVMTKNPDWWGWKDKKFDGNVTEIIYTPITNDATRLSALIAGNVDLINDPAPQDVPKLAQTPGVKVIEGFEQRIVFLGMDQARDELLFSNVKGKNPLKDKRVRQALYQAIDINAIHKSTMRGLSKPTGGMTPSPAQATPEIEKRLPFDPNAAKKLLADAGYPKGFEVQLDCPNNRYVNDEKICQAVAAMWAKIGVDTKLVTLPRAQYFPKLEKLDTSIYMLGWGGASTDSIFTLQPVLSTYNGKGDGDYNYGRYTNSSTFDGLVAEIKVEMNTEKRLALIRRALAVHNAEIHTLPLHRQVIPWAARSNVDLPASCGQPGLADLGEDEVAVRAAKRRRVWACLVRILLAVLLGALSTWNPSGWSYVDWALRDRTTFDAVKAFVGVVLLGGWVFCLRAAWVSLGALGLVLVALLLGTIVWMLVQFGVVPADNRRLLVWIVLVAVGDRARDRAVVGEDAAARNGRNRGESGTLGGWPSAITAKRNYRLANQGFYESESA